MPIDTTGRVDGLRRCGACGHEWRGAASADACPKCGAEGSGKDLEAYAPSEAPARPAGGPDGEGRARDPSTGATVAGYKLEERVGDGATSAVYKAIDPQQNDKVAVKVLRHRGDSEALERFNREARLARRIKHPNLVHVRGSGVDDQSGAHYLVMDLVEGETLDALILRHGRLPWRQALELVFQVAQAVDQLRKHGCVHRDIKPQNILVAEGVAKLTDLGFVKPVSEAPNDHDTLIMGTPAYMAPEQAVDARGATHAADVYALGATLYHSLTGRPPFLGSDGDEIMKRIHREEPPTPHSLVPQLPQSVDALVRWAMAKDPSERPQAAADLSLAIQRILANPENTETIARQRRRLAWPLMHVAIVIAAVAALAALFWALLALAS